MAARCMGRSAHGRCASAPRYSVSTHMDQRDDFRSCGRHLSWVVNYLSAEHGKDVVVVAQLKRGSR